MQENAWGDQFIKGPVYMRCPHCGHIYNRILKDWQENYCCPRCKMVVSFCQMRKVTVRCRCGRWYFYLTNMTGMYFSLRCPHCHRTVAVEYDSKRGKYQTVKCANN